ncbi:hypothetical protein Hdeb2414_s0033g00719191 [Helianthus debilis subsp. tardiflorus]
MEDIEFPLKQGPEVKLTERRKKVKKSAAKIKKETLVMHADDAATSIDALHVDCVRNAGILSNNDVELLGTEKRLGEVLVENIDDISEVKLPDRRKKVKKSAAKIKKETLVMHADDAATSIDALHVDCVRNDGILSSNDVELLGTEKRLGEVQVENIDDISEVKLPDRRKKVKKSAAKIKKETLVMHADDNLVGDISSTVNAPILDEKVIAEKCEVLETTIDDDSKKNDEMIVKKIEVSEPSCRHRVRVENMEEKSKDIVGSRKRKTDVEKTASKNGKNDESVVKQSDDCARNDDMLMNNDVESLGTKVENIDDISEKQKEKMDGIKKNTRKRKSKKSASRNEDESITKHVNGEIFDNVTKGDSNLPDGGREDEQQLYDGLTGKVKKKKNKSSLAGPQDRLSKLPSTEAELESKKSQSVYHGQLPEDTSKNVTGSEVSKVNNEVCITNDGSSEINFMDHFAPGRKSKKTSNKTKDDSRNSGAIRSWKIISKNENNKAVTDPNIDDESSSSSKSFGRSYHHQKSNKQQSVAGPMKKNLPAVNGVLLMIMQL